MAFSRLECLHRVTSVLPVVLAMACSTGCGSKPAVLTGTVTYQGKPLDGGSVILYCSDEQIVRGIIGPDGSYSIPNVPRGVCRVTVKTHAPTPAGFQLKQQLPPVKDGPIPPAPPPSFRTLATLIPERYALPEESGLTVRVDRMQTVFDISLVP